MKKLSLVLTLGVFSYSSFAGTSYINAKPMDGGCVAVTLSCGQGGAACGEDMEEVLEVIDEMEEVYCGN